MTTYNHPGIYIEELPSPHSIQGASTTIAAFVGVTETGPFEQPILITSWNQYQRQFGALVWFSMLSWSVYYFFAEGGAACYVIRARDMNSGMPASGILRSLTVHAVVPGQWANILSISITEHKNNNSSTPFTHFNVLADASHIDSSNSQSVNGLMKEFVKNNPLSTQIIDGKKYFLLETFTDVIDEKSNPNFESSINRVNQNSMFIRVLINTGKESVKSNLFDHLLLSNGIDAKYNLDAAIKALSTLSDVSLLAVPDIAIISDDSGAFDLQQQHNSINTILSFCKQQGNLFYVVDPPFHLSVSEISNFKTGDSSSTPLNSSYGAIYYPWLWTYHVVSSLNVPIPPSGAVLGRYVYTDVNVGVFKSPAGINDGFLSSIVGLQNVITDNDQDMLNPEGINAIRNFINYGNVIYGARTLSNDRDWTYISIRRLVIFVEQSLRQSLQWVVFEPNDQRLWTNVTSSINTFLTSLWDQGGLMGATASEAFFVTCNASNNPPETRMSGELYIDIGLAIIYPAEFIVLRVTQITAGVAIQSP